MLSGERALDDLHILRDVVRFSRDSQTNLLLTAGAARPSAPVPATLASSPGADRRLQKLLPGIVDRRRSEGKSPTVFERAEALVRTWRESEAIQHSPI
jgi:hypothetical protein